MEPQPTYEELAETIAQCVYDKNYLEVSRYYAENGELVELGKGKRMIVRGGKLNAKYQITVPEDMHGDE